MRHLALSPAQHTAVELLGNPHSVVVATGQQIGLLGGPMYTLYKIASTAATAREIHASLRQLLRCSGLKTMITTQPKQAQRIWLRTTASSRSLRGTEQIHGDLCHLVIIQQANPKQLHLQSQR
jgi:hypothetical protein